MADIQTEAYVARARQAVRDDHLHQALTGLQDRLGKGALAAYRKLPEGPELRHIAHRIREEDMAHLDVLLESLADKIEKRGGHVYFAETAKDAVDYCLDIAKRNGVKRVVKGKSMLSEEIAINPALEAAGITPVETDLGEYIVQLAGEHPSHIIAPAIHMTRDQVGRLFTEKLGIAYTDDPPTLTRAARIALREKFLAADMGLSGCNIACAETGHITTLSNEGNIRMATTLPKIHMAFMGMERITARLESHDILLRLLSRGAAAQTMAGYVSYIGGPAPAGQTDGPEEFHLVILDNGRSRILADPEFREILCCIRCGGCLNACPVYAKIGGHAYGYPYCGPIGAVVTPLLVGVNRAKDLCQGETLCGACRDLCPVAIDQPRMLIALRANLADGDPAWGVARESIVEK
ncbi:MAG TPA: LutB/LldF family L-lactate oxidation iron-sulfur protein, partial [Desulfosarcina sp.]|nr:LutB/LldF family L-lactate oxidation iron-sulfur protein [Desulfosarcina sp.]